MPHLHTEWWSLEIPEDWLVEHDEQEGLVTLADPDDLGAVDIRVILPTSDSAISLQAAQQLAESSLKHADEIFLGAEPVTVGQFDGFAIAFGEEGMAWREWFLLGNDCLLLISHYTDQEQKGLDDMLVDDILDCLVKEPALE